MASDKWVCFACRVVVRRRLDDLVSSYNTPHEVRCPVCGQRCVFLEKKIPIPPKSKVRQWEALRQQFNQADFPAKWEEWKIWRIYWLEDNLRQLDNHKLRAEKQKLESQRHRVRLLRPDALSQDWPRIHRQIQRYRNSTRPLATLDWTWAETKAWLRKQPENLLLVFEKEHLVCRVSADVFLSLLTQEAPSPGETPSPDISLANLIIFPPHFNCALFPHPEGRFTFCQTAGKS
ncbi:MAG: hypothetical protein LBO00_08800 [Zoogloeaceae bacterium]|jgi:hypothetical protein|nr:hypothetical protein [Zoogloeaceae bacterium]